MRLVSLKIYKKVNNETIRYIKFNEYGLSLICDEEGTETKSSGSSIGKTAFIRCIDICLGAKTVTSIYKSKSHGENEELKQYIIDNQISLQLKIKNKKNKEYILERHLFDNKEYIDNEKSDNIKDYCEKLRAIIFPDSPKSISFRNLISKFIRIENEELFKYKDVYTKNNVYFYAYFYLLGLYFSEEEFSLETEMLELKRNIEKIKSTYKIKTIEEFELLKESKLNELDEKKKELIETDYVEGFSLQDDANSDLITELDDLTNDLYIKQYRLKILESNVAKEEDKIFKIDEDVLEQMYGDASNVFGGLIKSFDEFVVFHNDMCSLRKQRYINEISRINEEIIELENELEEIRRGFSKKFVDFKKNVNDKSESLYDIYYLTKTYYYKLENDYNIINSNLNRIEEIKDSLSQIEKEKEINASKQKHFNTIFKERSIRYINECYELIFKNSPAEMPISARGLGGALGTGDNKALICALDFSFYEYYIEKQMHLPLFVIHDRMENVSLEELNMIFNDVRNIGVQYILPILHDRIDTLNIKEEEIVLRLTKDDKLLKF